MDIDRLVKLVEAEVKRLLEEGKGSTTLPPPKEPDLLVLGLHSPPGEALLQQLEKEGATPLAWQEGAAVDKFQTILVWDLNWTDVAKVALGLFDTPPLQTLFDAVVKGKKVLIPPLSLPPQCPPALQDLLNRYWQTILSFGIEPASSTSSSASSSTPSSTSSPPPSPPKKLIITQDDVREAKEKGLQLLTIPAGSIVTDLARELAERLNLEIKEVES